VAHGQPDQDTYPIPLVLNRIAAADACIAIDHGVDWTHHCNIAADQFGAAPGDRQ
jgi:hypothetical protein